MSEGGVEEFISSSMTQGHDKMYNDELKLLIVAFLSYGHMTK